MEIKGNIISLLLKTEGLLTGHFLLSSGLHSPRYLQHPKQASHLGKELAKKFVNQKIDVVVGLALGGIIIAHEIARDLGVRAVFSEREEGQMKLRRGFKINPDEKVLVVEDVITTGGSVKEVIDLISSLGGKIMGVATLVDRNQGKVVFNTRFESLAVLDIETYEPKGCPLCKQGIPLVKPGSKQI
jgi:orotate phosphoribosyltransferase